MRHLRFARCCPSPTDTAHVGLIRTALFNWTFPLYNQGELIFRIEDTDAAAIPRVLRQRLYRKELRPALTEGGDVMDRIFGHRGS